MRSCLSANEVLNKVRVRIALNYLLNRADALGLSIPGSEPSYRNYFSTIVGYSGLHGIRANDSKTALRALVRRHALLAAYLDAVNRIDGPNHCRRAAELRLVHRPRRDLPACRVVQFPQRAPSRAGEASPTERPASERFGAKQRGVVQTSNPTGWKWIVDLDKRRIGVGPAPTRVAPGGPDTSSHFLHHKRAFD